jgi:hypothetical protein
MMFGRHLGRSLAAAQRAKYVKERTAQLRVRFPNASDADLLAMADAEDARREQERDAALNAKQAALLRTKIYRHSRGWIDQYGKPVSNEMAGEIRRVRASYVQR